MKKAIELLRAAHGLIDGLCGQNEDEKRWLDEALLRIGHALVILKDTPRWETPERWKERTGEEWPDNWAVYFRRPKTKRREYAPELGYIRWVIGSWGTVRRIDDICHFQIICATEAGCPPNDWKPEEA
jgi:hypothetical protein